MHRWWISWVQITHDYRPVTFPPQLKILGWWCSGETENGEATLVALVEARNESEARDAILKDWPEALEYGDWRFFEKKPIDFLPCDRFILSDWMSKRINHR